MIAKMVRFVSASTPWFGQAGVSQGPDAGTWRVQAAVIVLALNIFAQTTALGANDEFLQALAAAANIAVALLILILLPPSERFWRKSAVVFLLLGGGLLWACLPEIAHAYGFTSLLPGPAPIRRTPDLALLGVCRYFGGVAALLSGAMIGYHRGATRSAIDWLLIFGMLNLLIGLILRAMDPEHVWGMAKPMHELRFTGTFQNANVAAAIFAFLAVLGLGRVLTLIRDGGFVRGGTMSAWLVARIIIVLAAFGACVIAASRASLALMVLAMAALAYAWYAPDVPRGRRLFIAIIILIAVCALIWLSGAFDLLIAERMGQMGVDSVYRGEIYARLWRLFLESPLYGFGLGSFSDMNIYYLDHAREARDFSYINAAHNQALQLMLAGGWPFLILQFLAGALIVRRAVRRNVVKDPSQLAVWLALGVILGCAMIDIALTVPSVVTLASAVLGILWGRGLRIHSSDRETPTP